MSTEVLITLDNSEANDSSNSRPGFLTPPSGQMFISRVSIPMPVKIRIHSPTSWFVGAERKTYMSLTTATLERKTLFPSLL